MAPRSKARPNFAISSASPLWADAWSFASNATALFTVQASR